MKLLHIDNNFNLETKPFFQNIEKTLINSEYFKNYINSNITPKSFYENLEQAKNVELYILNSKITLKEPNNNSLFEKSEIYLKIKEIINRYEDYPLIDINKFPNVSLTPQPLYNVHNYFNLSPHNNLFPNLNGLNNIFNINQNNSNFIFKLIQNPFNIDLFSKKGFVKDNKLNTINNYIYLKNKRKVPFPESKKKLKKYKVLITTFKDKERNEKKNLEINSKKINNKKVLFKLDKKLKNIEKIKIRKNPGRKKKNSGEIGVHNKFSKDNMMRKLKNKVIESARKLINRTIKIESGDDFKEFGELRKIQGIFCQELNIKFNFWFYFQKLKTIFQLKMSSKYSKGDLTSNYLLISKIYSKQYINKFPKTIKLLETMFYQYYHDIFLGEKNWTKEFDIIEEENKYQINNIINFNESEEKKVDLRYGEKIKKFAKKYELFFLEKNPRIIGNKNEEKVSQTKEIIKNISIQDFERYKYYFILKSIHFLPEIKNSYVEYINKYKDLYNDDIKSIFLEEIYDKDIYFKINEVIGNKEENNINICKKEIEREESKKSDDIKLKNSTDSIKPVKFYIKTIESFKKIKNRGNKEEKKENKPIKFFIKRNESKSKTEFKEYSNNNYNEKIHPKQLFFINKNYNNN